LTRSCFLKNEYLAEIEALSLKMFSVNALGVLILGLMLTRGQFYEFTSAAISGPSLKTA
jgi:hypothetical protein